MPKHGQTPLARQPLIVRVEPRLRIISCSPNVPEHASSPSALKQDCNMLGSVPVLAALGMRNSDLRALFQNGKSRGLSMSER